MTLDFPDRRPLPVAFSFEIVVGYPIDEFPGTKDALAKYAIFDSTVFGQFRDDPLMDSLLDLSVSPPYSASTMP